MSNLKTPTTETDSPHTERGHPTSDTSAKHEPVSVVGIFDVLVPWKPIVTSYDCIELGVCCMAFTDACSLAHGVDAFDIEGVCEVF